MPRSVLVTAAGHAHAGGQCEGVAAVLDDLADALRAYDRLARLRLGDASAEPLVVTRTEAACAGEPDRAGKADALVLGTNGTDGPEEALHTLAEDGAIGHGRPAYLVFVEDAGDAESSWADAEASAQTLEAACEGAGLAWAGGLVVPGWALVPGLLRHPRMGILRRPLSEATDDLVAAIRSGFTVEEAARTFAWPARELAVGRSDLIAVRDNAAARLFATLARQSSVRDPYPRSR